jgi:asparagine synthetase B (glutamine-hydrolysing)
LIIETTNVRFIFIFTERKVAKIYGLMLHRTVKKYIESHNLLPEGAKVIVALSGGADSVALMDILYRLDYACIGAHVNFHLRGDESDRDAAFSHQVCRDLGVPFYKADLYAAEYAEEEVGLSSSAKSKAPWPLPWPITGMTVWKPYSLILYEVPEFVG